MRRIVKEKNKFNEKEIMIYKIPYKYTEYKDYPEATEISESRERLKIVYPILIPLVVIFALPSLLLYASKSLFGVLLLLCFIANIVLVIIYRIKYYDKVTEKRIIKAINKWSTMDKEIKESKFIVNNIKYLCDVNNAKCMICYKNTCSSKYRIKNNIGTRDIPICNECLENFKSNSPNL